MPEREQLDLAIHLMRCIEGEASLQWSDLRDISKFEATIAAEYILTLLLKRQAEIHTQQENRP